jgi:hypothetical protein
MQHRAERSSWQLAVQLVAQLAAQLADLKLNPQGPQARRGVLLVERLVLTRARAPASRVSSFSLPELPAKVSATYE